jgi:endoglucanase
MVGHVGLREFAKGIAESHDIPYQLTHLKRGGTDAGKIHLAGSGSPSIAICLPCRYLHSHTSVIHQDDYDQTVRLVTEVIKALDTDTVQRITYG